MGKTLGRLLRILAWLSPVYQFRCSVYRKCGVKVGRNVYIGFQVLMDGEFPEFIEIEDEASVGPGVSIMTHSGASPLHQRFKIYHEQPKRVTIKRGAWIATNAVILPGVTIGEGAIVAAGAVVSKDVLPYTMVAGNPARPVQELKRPKKAES